MKPSRLYRVFRFVAKRVAAVGQRWPRLTLMGADLLAPTSRKRLRIPSADELRLLLPHLSPERARAVSDSLLRSEVRQDVLIYWWVRSGRPGLRELIRDAHVPALPKPPLIVVTFHLGPLTALGAALEASIGPVLAPVERRRVGDSAALRERRRTRTFYEAAQFLRAGGSVVIALDPYLASWIRVPFFGGTAPLARGAFALSRMTGAPIVPAVVRWRGTRVEVVAGETLEAADGPDREHALAATTARWLEDYLRANPEEISLRILDLMQR
jgi:lauroyl/myristoyl acyltransferase